jgi:hypothetical protein
MEAIENKSGLNGEKQILKDEKGRFLPGNNANPAGRGVGVRDKANQIKAAIFEAFEQTGGMKGMIEWIERDRRNRKEFYKMVLQILPKELNLEGEGMGDTHIHISPEKVLIFKDMQNAKDDGRADNLHAAQGTGSNRV